MSTAHLLNATGRGRGWGQGCGWEEEGGVGRRRGRSNRPDCESKPLCAADLTPFRQVTKSPLETIGDGNSKTPITPVGISTHHHFPLWHRTRRQCMQRNPASRTDHRIGEHRTWHIAQTRAETGKLQTSQNHRIGNCVSITWAAELRLASVPFIVLCPVCYLMSGFLSYF